MSSSEINKLRGIFHRNRHRTFLIEAQTGRKFTYGKFEELSLKAANFLEKSGVEKGSHVALSLPNCAEFEIMYFACMQLGAVAVPLNPLFQIDEAREILENSHSELLVAASADLGAKADKYSTIANTSNVELITIEKNFIENIEKKEKFLDAESLGRVSDNDSIAIFYTSGTTGKPKGVEMKYSKMFRNASVFISVLGMQKDLRFYNFLPLSYLGGFYNLTIIPTLAQGSILLDEAFGPKTALEIWKRAKKFDVNAFWFVPTIMAILLSIDRSTEGEQYCRKCVKLCLVGTAPLHPEMKKKFEQRYGVTLYENYGLSETFFSTTNSPLYDVRGVGKLLPGCKIRIIDDKGNMLETGKDGEIIVKSEYMMDSYYNNIDEMAGKMVDGWFVTGDIGHLDSESYLFITGRKKDLFKRGGILISPLEIENCILQMRGVYEAAVIGVENEISGEEPVAFVKAEPTISQEAILAHCRQNLASFKVPSRIILVDDFPRAGGGKIQKAKLKNML